MTAVFVCQFPARDAVAAGARLLDQLAPTWAMRVQPGTLDVDLSQMCPLGQIYGWFDDAPLFFDCDGGAYGDDGKLRAQSLGFWSMPTLGEEDDCDDAGNAAALNQRWREEIYDRSRLLTPAWVLAA